MTTRTGIWISFGVFALMDAALLFVIFARRCARLRGNAPLGDDHGDRR